MPDLLMYIVVGDRGLNAGNGTFVATVEAMRDRLVQESRSHNWTLVISIHGDQDCIATRGGSLASCSGPGAYNADAIRRIFQGDSEESRRFVEWRGQNGPSLVVLNACQVNRAFEQVIVNALLRPGSSQSPQGLGRGCRPGTEVMTLEYNNTPVRNRRQWMRIRQSDRPSLLAELHRLNREYGYFGAPSVPNGLVLQYYFDEEPFGGWPVVRVTHLRRQTSIPFYNRTMHPQFLRQCTGHIEQLPGRRPTVPPPLRRETP